jgi:hypothetical protein
MGFGQTSANDYLSHSVKRTTETERVLSDHRRTALADVSAKRAPVVPSSKVPFIRSMSESVCCLYSYSGRAFYVLLGHVLVVT